MKIFLVGFGFATLLFVLLFVRLHQLGKYPRHIATAPDPRYQEWLTRTESLAAAPSPGSVEAEAMLERVRQAFTPFEGQRAGELFPKAYADSFYFRDAFHLFTDRTALTDYMVKTAESSPGVTFIFHPALQKGIDFHLPWVMVIPGRKGLPDQHSLGMSHLRFNSEGQVIFHQDYWDSADVLVPRVPVANGIIEWVRRRF
jgi:hypothetical protein